MYNHSYKNALAYSSSFTRQGIIDPLNDAIKLNSCIPTPPVKLTKYLYRSDSSTDIDSINYFSNGKSLNATIWLNGVIEDPPNFSYRKSSNETILKICGSFEEQPKPTTSRLVYGMLIDADSNNATGKGGADYQVELQWDDAHKKWFKIFAEYSPLGQQKVLNITNSSQIGHSITNPEYPNYIALSADLNSMGSPNNYRVAFYSGIVYDFTTQYWDFSNWVDVPPPKFHMSTSPSPVILTKGNTHSITAELKTTGDFVPRVKDFIPSSNSILNVKFNPYSSKKLYDSPQPFEITIPDDAPDGQYTIPIRANMQVESLFPTAFIAANYPFKLTSLGNITGLANLTINVREPPSFQEQFKNFWDTYGQPISIIAGGFAGGVASLFFDRFKKGKNEDEATYTSEGVRKGHT